MKPRAVFAIPEDRNKVLDPRIRGRQGLSVVKNSQFGGKKKGSEEPRLSQAKRESSIASKLWIGLHATLA